MQKPRHKAQSLPVTPADIDAAAGRIAGAVKRTPASVSKTLSEISGCAVHLKFETFQFTGSFKERGALNKLLRLSEEERGHGVITLSAGNHAQAVAYHCSRLGIPATVVMPTHTPFTKVKHTEDFGANVVLEGDSFAAAGEAAMAIKEEQGLTLVHPFDDSLIMAGQGTVSREFLTDYPDLDTLIVPVGGGGLISGCAVAAKEMNPDIEIIGVQTTAFPGMTAALEGRELTPTRQTIADGIAVKAPGKLTRPVVAALVDDIVLVSDGEIEHALCLLMEIEKTVAEGAGSAALAALLSNPERFRGRKAGLIVSGANIDTRTLAACLMRGLYRDGRMVRISAAMEDVPGSLAKLAAVIAREGGNIIEVLHQRMATDVSLRYTDIEILIETKDRYHSDRIVRALTDAGFDVTVRE